MTRISLAVGLAAAALFLAAGCGNGGAGREAWIKQCAKGGDDRKTCTCVADELQKNLDRRAFRAMMLDAEGKREEANSIRNKMPMDRKMAAMNVAMKAAGKCAAGVLR
jgi:hypothetical protein